MQWYSYSRNSDFDKPRSIIHRCDEDRGGFEYEYCFAEYEYRVAEYDTNRKTQPRASLLFSHPRQFAKHKLRGFTHLIPRILLFPRAGTRSVTKKLLRSKHDISWFAVFFASLLLCVSHTHPSHGLRGPCYGVVLRRCLGSPSPPVGGEGDLRHSKRHGIRNINVPTTDLVLHRYYQLKISSLRYQRCSKHPSPKGHLIHHPKIPSK